MCSPLGRARWGGTARGEGACALSGGWVAVQVPPLATGIKDMHTRRLTKRDTCRTRGPPTRGWTNSLCLPQAGTC